MTLSEKIHWVLMQVDDVFPERIPHVMAVAICGLLMVSLSACTILDKEHVSKTEVPLILGPKPTPSSRWGNTCVVDTEKQLRSIGRDPVIHDFWHQTPTYDAPLFPPNLTHAGLLTMNRCHIQGTARLRTDGYVVFSANSQDRPRGKGDRRWALNNCPSLPSSQGGGAHLFVVNLGTYTAKPGYAWRNKLDSSETTPITHHVTQNVLLNIDDGVGAPFAGSLEKLWHPGGIDGVGDFLYVGFDDNAKHESYLKVFDMADPTNPTLVGGRGFKNHMAQALGVTDLSDGRMLLAVVDTNRDPWQVHFYIENADSVAGEVIRHDFIKAGTWWQSTDSGSTIGFPFLKYQSLALLRECGTEDIYLIGIHNDRRLRCGGLLEIPGFRAPTRVDLYQVHLPNELGPGASIGLEPIVRRNMRDHHGEGCAGATAHITPQGQIVAYTIEHGGSRKIDAGQYPGGIKRWVGKVRFYEFSTRVAMVQLIDADDTKKFNDMCPDEEEDLDGFNDDDGCPDEDNDRDGIPDVADLCPNDPEDPDGINDHDGCSETDQEIYVGRRVVISYKRLFSDTGDFKLSKPGRFLVNGLVDFWQEHGKADLCVLAHTNGYSDIEAEQNETEQWAATVRQAMIDHGVPASQIKAHGYGSRIPVVHPAHPAAERLNVRVEFTQCLL